MCSVPTVVKRGCFCPVKDVMGALTRPIEPPDARGQLFNACTPEKVSIKDLAEGVITLSASRMQIRDIPCQGAKRADFEDMLRRIPALSKIEMAIGYPPTYSVGEITRDIFG